MSTSVVWALCASTEVRAADGAAVLSAVGGENSGRPWRETSLKAASVELQAASIM